jgi:putative oxidoreductase
MNPLAKINLFLAKTGGALRSPLLLVIRLYWGYQFILTGKGKLLNLERTANFFASLNIPMPKLNAIMASSTELGCGTLLLLGLFSRCASLALVGVMSVAYLTADSDALHSIFSDTDKFTGATPFLFMYAALIVLVFGPGKFAVDRYLSNEPKA